MINVGGKKSVVLQTAELNISANVNGEMSDPVHRNADTSAKTSISVSGNWFERSACDQQSKLGRPLFLVFFFLSSHRY